MIYSKKQLKDIRIILRKQFPNKVLLYLIELPVCISAKCKTKFNGLKSLLRQGLLEPEFYGDLVYKLKNTVGSNNFSAQFIKIISHNKKIGYSIHVLQQTAYMVVNPITVGNFASVLIARRWVGLQTL